MVNRGVAKQLSQQEIAHWKGPVFYISHLAVENARSSSTPVRIVFNSSQKHRGISLNDFPHQGPRQLHDKLSWCHSTLEREQGCVHWRY